MEISIFLKSLGIWIWGGIVILYAPSATKFPIVGAYQNPEVYPRPDGTVYICGYNDKEPLPEHADLIEPNEESILGLQKLSKHISPQLAG